MKTRERKRGRRRATPQTAVEIACAGITTPSSDRRASSHGPHAHGIQIAPSDPNASCPHGLRHPHRADRHRSRVYASTRFHGRRLLLMHRWWTGPTNLHRLLRPRGPCPITSSCFPPSRLPASGKPGRPTSVPCPGERNLEPVPGRSDAGRETAEAGHARSPERDPFDASALVSSCRVGPRRKEKTAQSFSRSGNKASDVPDLSNRRQHFQRCPGRTTAAIVVSCGLIFRMVVQRCNRSRGIDAQAVKCEKLEAIRTMRVREILTRSRAPA
jgi:hypothetical protein